MPAHAVASGASPPDGNRCVLIRVKRSIYGKILESIGRGPVGQGIDQTDEDLEKARQ